MNGSRTLLRFGSTLAFVSAVLLSEIPASGQSPSGSPMASGTAGIEGVDWQLRQARLSGAFGDIPASVNATLRLDAGQASGSGGCNRFAGSYRLDGTSLSFERMLSTEMACSEPAMTIETFYLADLGAVSGYALDGSSLSLLEASGQTVLRFEAAVRPDVVGDWVVTELQVEGALSLVRGHLTAVFQADGTVTGSSGCNTFRGPYTVIGRAIDIGPLSSTRMLCVDAGIMADETAYLAALESSSTVAATPEGGLQLDGADGTLEVLFAPDPAAA